MNLFEATDSLVSNVVPDCEESRSRLDSLLRSDLGFSATTLNGSRHSWHPFPARFPPALPRLFVENLTRPGEIVLDPMVGSGTTVIEAAQLGRQAIGFDIDPLALINVATKTFPFEPGIIIRTGNTIVNSAFARLANKRAELQVDLNERFDDETRAFLDYWFLKETQEELLALVCEIEKLNEGNLRSLFKTVFSSVIIAKTGGVSRAQDLAHTRPHRVASKKINSALTEFQRRVSKIAQGNRLQSLWAVRIEQANAKNLPLADRSVDLVVTSPPYANNAIDYMRAHKFSLVWFDYSISQLKQLRKTYIGSESSRNGDLRSLPSLSREIVEELSARNPQKGAALHHYYSEMTMVLQELFRVLRVERACVVVVATSLLNGLDVQTHRCLAEIAERVGFELAHIAERSIHRDRRMLPVSKTQSGSQIETRMHTEYVLGLWKA